MRVALIIASALALALAIVIAVGGDDEDDPVIETTPVTTPETAPEAVETTPEEPLEPEPAPDTDGDGVAEALLECGQIVFEPNTDSGAARIEAAGTDCATARDVARAARNATDELTFEANGFRCTGGQADQPLSAIEWFCIGADRSVVSFLTS